MRATLVLFTGCLGEEPLQSFDHLDGTRLTSCIQYEATDFGEQFESCKIILQFYHPGSQEQTPPPPTGNQLLEGECVYYEPNESEQPPLFEEIGIDAGDSITLYNDQHSIELMRFENDGNVQYSVASCDPDSFPFGELFHISVSGSAEAQGIPAFDLDNAILFGNNIDMVTPATAASTPIIGADYELIWQSDAHGITESTFLNVDNRLLRIENWLSQSERETVECIPSATGIVVEDQVLQQLQAFDNTTLAIQFGTITNDVELPWGERFSSYASSRFRGNLNWQ